MKKNKTKKVQPKALSCNCWCCKPVPKPWDIIILFAAGILIVYVFIKMSVAIY